MIDQQSANGTMVSSSVARGSASSVDIIKQLDKLEELVEDSIQVVGRAIFINVDQFFTYTNKIRAFLPEELKRASQYSQESERLMVEADAEVRRALGAAQAEARNTVGAAQAEAQRYLDEVNQRAAQLVSTSEIRRQAEAQASEIIAAAEREAGGLRQGAEDYARQVLDRLEDAIDQAKGPVQRGKAQLERKNGRMPER